MKTLLAVLLVLCWTDTTLFGVENVADDTKILQNHWIAVQVRLVDGHLQNLELKDRTNGRVLRIADIFSIDMRDGTEIRSQDMAVVAPETLVPLQLTPSASRYSERQPGQEICTDLSYKAASMEVRWCGILREGSPYFRQRVRIQAKDKPLQIRAIRLIDVVDPDAVVCGTVRGSPISDSTMFFGFEHPLSVSTVQHGHAEALLERELPLEGGSAVEYTSVIGVAPVGQMRRAFLGYLERERAHPYRPFLHYNSWYDLGFGDQSHGARYTSEGAVERIREFGTELVRKRNVQLDSFLFDDGWDDTKTVWNFNSGFPGGFASAKKAAEDYGAGIGVWLSPWGGYDKEKKERVASGRAGGYEVANDGLALSGPKYYARFEAVCLEMMRKYGANFFKFDGTGNANQVFAGSGFDSDFGAAIHLIERLRAENPDLFINLTTGTHPSPFWLFYADSIWRGGDDHNFAGVGSSRQRWITFRDAQTYKNVVQQAPLYPLNSLMLHGLIYATQADGLNSDPEHDFSDEVRSYFGSGTQLQEMYISPALLSSRDWDILAESAKWARQNAAILKDTHWIGGDPEMLQVYGWAAWAPEKGIIVLRNPSDKAQSFMLEVENAFELPFGAIRQFVGWHLPNDSGSGLTLRAGTPVKIDLKPFEVQILEAIPQTP